jgi:hypothetical protein
MWFLQAALSGSHFEYPRLCRRIVILQEAALSWSEWRLLVERRGYTAWTKTPGGGTYYLAVILLDLILSVPLVSPSGLSIIKPRGTTMLVGIAIACLLVLLYVGAKRQERKYLKMHGSTEKEVYEASSTKKIIEDFIFPPAGVLVVTAVMWFAAGAGVDKILGARIVALTSILSLLTLLYPLAQRLCIYRQ